MDRILKQSVVSHGKLPNFCLRGGPCGDSSAIASSASQHTEFSSAADPSFLYGEPSPVAGVATMDDRTPEEIQRWWKLGLRAIAEGKLAVVLLSGGQVQAQNREVLIPPI